GLSLWRYRLARRLSRWVFVVGGPPKAPASRTGYATPFAKVTWVIGGSVIPEWVQVQVTCLHCVARATAVGTATGSWSSVSGSGSVASSVWLTDSGCMTGTRELRVGGKIIYQFEQLFTKTCRFVYPQKCTTWIGMLPDVRAPRLVRRRTARSTGCSSIAL